MGSAELLKTRIREARATGVVRVTVDLRGVSFIEARGMHVVLDEAKIAAATDRVMLDVVANDRIHDVLRLAGVHGQLQYSQGWVIDRAIAERASGAPRRE